MLKHRLIAVIILRDGQVVQSVKFKHTNVIHYDAIHAIESFNRWCVDEIAFINVSPDRASQATFKEIVTYVSSSCFVPLSVGGWIDSYAYGAGLLASGADKIMLNTAFHTDAEMVKKLSRDFGAQAIIASLDVKNDEQGEARVFVDRATHNTGISPAAWAQHCQAMGAGEIFFNSVEFDGARKGYDLDNLQAVCKAVSVPVIAFGGAFRWPDFIAGFSAGADAVAAANIFHYTEHSTKHAKRHIHSAGIPIRMEGIS